MNTPQVYSDNTQYSSLSTLWPKLEFDRGHVSDQQLRRFSFRYSLSSDLTFAASTIRLIMSAALGPSCLFKSLLYWANVSALDLRRKEVDQHTVLDDNLPPPSPGLTGNI